MRSISKLMALALVVTASFWQVGCDKGKEVVELPVENDIVVSSHPVTAKILAKYSKEEALVSPYGCYFAYENSLEEKNFLYGLVQIQISERLLNQVTNKSDFTTLEYKYLSKQGEIKRYVSCELPKSVDIVQRVMKLISADGEIPEILVIEKRERNHKVLVDEGYCEPGLQNCQLNEIEVVAERERPLFETVPPAGGCRQCWASGGGPTYGAGGSGGGSAGPVGGVGTNGTTPTNISPIPGIPYEIWAKLTKTEKALCVSNARACVEVYLFSRVAIESTRHLFGICTSTQISNCDGAPGNAFQHAYWAAMITARYGAAYAKLWLDAHERVSYEYARDSHILSFTDYYNNAIGRDIGTQFFLRNPPATLQEIHDAVLEASNRGRLRNWACPTPGVLPRRTDEGNYGGAICVIDKESMKSVKNV